MSKRFILIPHRITEQFGKHDVNAVIYEFVPHISAAEGVPD
jgi:hypothetical protein